MNQDHWYFEIDHKNTIRFDLQTKVSDVFRYVEMEVMLCSENKEEILVFSDFLIVALRELKWPLEQLLAGSFKLHYSVTKDIGYLWNESLHGIELPSKKNSEGYEFWVGQKYLSWSTPRSNTSTWFYEKDEKYYLEVTPDYPWHFSDPQEGEEFISYEEFMKNYKPIALFELSRQTLEEWLKKVTEFISIVEANDSKYFIKKS